MIICKMSHIMRTDNCSIEMTVQDFNKFAKETILENDQHKVFPSSVIFFEPTLAVKRFLLYYLYLNNYNSEGLGA